MKAVNEADRLRAFVERYDHQKDAAEALEISGPYLSDLLKGRRPFSARMLEKLGLRQIVVEAR